MLSISCNAAFLAAIAAMYSEVCSDPRVGFRYLKQCQWMDNGDNHVNTTQYKCKHMTLYCNIC
jgi:hypothetical protein